MAVVNKLGSAARDTTSPPITLIPAEVSGLGHISEFFSTGEIANGDSATSTLYFGEIPSNARIMRNSAVDCDAVTGLTDFDLGLGQGFDIGAGVVKSVNCLIDGADLHLAASKSAVTNVDIANLGQTAWQLAGYADDPGGMLSVIGTLNQAATAAGTISLTLLLSTP